MNYYCKLCILLVFLFGTSLSVVELTCSFQSCPKIKEDRINVHIVPFSVEELYLDYADVFASLKINKERRFTFNEVSPFWEWWLKQKSKFKDTVTNLVNNGQVEFSGGGWTMNDEAVTNYQSIIDQMTWGLRKLNDTFGKCGQPKVGWQYGVFGHSREMANIYNKLGYDGVIIGHIGYLEKQARIANKSSLELIWQGSKALGASSNIFTSIVYEDQNGFKTALKAKVKTFLSKVQNAAQHYATRNVLIPVGSDKKDNPGAIFKMIDSIPKYFKQAPDEEKKFNILYSTPACYLQAVHKENKGTVKGSVKQDDFLPYSNDTDHFFTGFYTSNPSLKRFERLGNNFLQICKQLGALVNFPNEPKIDSLRQAMGDVQRQDGITGAGCKEMQEEYPRKLYKGFVDCMEVVQDVLRTLTHDTEIKYEDCTLRMNITECKTSENFGNFIVTTYNPLSQARTKYVSLPISGNAYTVRASDGVELPTQIAPILFPDIPGRNGKTKKKLLFPARNIPPMGFKTFYVERLDKDDNNKIPYKESQEVTELKDQNLGFKIDPDTGFLKQFLASNTTIDFTQRFYTNKDLSSFPLDNKTTRQFASFIFEPEELPVEVAKKVEYKIYQGPIVQELHQKINNYIRNVFRIYTNETGIEAQWIIGPIPDNGRGTDVFTRFITNLSSNTTFYTDSNGREQLLRHKTEKTSPTRTQAASYYPTTSLINFKDNSDDLEFGVLVDRGQGGTVSKNGAIELMLDRRFAFQPSNSPLMREDFVEGVSYIILAHTVAQNKNEKSSKEKLRTMIEWKLFDTWSFVASANGLSYEQYKTQYKMEFQGITKSLPDNVKVMTLEPWKDDTILLRLNHIIPTGMDPAETEPEKIDIKNLFSTFEITSVKETTIGANQWLDENNKLQFKPVDQNVTTTAQKVDKDIQNFTVTLHPMEIRTFIVEVRR